jgi:predicted dehydrogenase
MKQVRFGIVGLGNMGREHVRFIAEAADKEFCTGAVCDILPGRAAEIGDQFRLPHFTDYRKMYASGLIDAVLIATPHYWHAPMSVRAAQMGLHVLCEKPLAVTVGAARTMIAQCKKHKVALGCMFMQRTRGIMMKIKELVASGKLGEVFRVSMVCSNWYRTQSYYTSGTWRGTWDGEGGGVLINQAPHSLDLFQWIGGLPNRVLATVDTRVHKIEVENTANAVCQYKGGKIGYIYATTAEAPGMEQFMISGDKGTLLAQGNSLRFARLEMPLARHLMTCPIGFEMPKFQWEDVAWKVEPEGKHINITRNFARHLTRGEKLICPGSEAINELEISNAIYIAGYRNKAVELPVNAAEIDKLIGKLQRERSTGKGGGLRAKAARELKALLA